MYLKELQANNMNSYLLPFMLHIEFCQLYFQNISTIRVPYFKRIVAITFWLLSLTPLLTHPSGFSRLPLGGPTQSFPGFSSYLHWPLPTSAPFSLNMLRTWFLSPGWICCSFCLGNLSTHGSQILHLKPGLNMISSGKPQKQNWKYTTFLPSHYLSHFSFLNLSPSDNFSFLCKEILSFYSTDAFLEPRKVFDTQLMLNNYLMNG